MTQNTIDFATGSSATAVIAHYWIKVRNLLSDYLIYCDLRTWYSSENVFFKCYFTVRYRDLEQSNLKYRGVFGVFLCVRENNASKGKQSEESHHGERVSKRPRILVRRENCTKIYRDHIISLPADYVEPRFISNLNLIITYMTSFHYTFRHIISID